MDHTEALAIMHELQDKVDTLLCATLHAMADNNSNRSEGLRLSMRWPALAVYITNLMADLDAETREDLLYLLENQSRSQDACSMTQSSEPFDPIESARRDQELFAEETRKEGKIRREGRQRENTLPAAHDQRG